MAESGALREMLAFFGVDVDDKAVERADKGMNKLGETALKVGELMAEAFAVREVYEFISGQIEMATQLSHTSEVLGITVGDLQAFQYAASIAHLSADEATTALRFLNKATGEAASGNKEAAASFAKLGVTIRDSNGHVRATQDILSDVADGFTKLPSAQERAAAAMGIFGRAGQQLIPLLNKGSQGINELYTEFEKLGGGIDEEFIQSAEEAEHQLKKFDLASRGLKTSLSAELLPVVTWLASEATEFAIGLRKMGENSYFAQTALWTLATVSGVIVAAWAAANIEIFLAVAALALLILAVDDVYTFFKGGDSLIGRFFDSLGGAGTQDQVRQFFKDLKGDFDKIWVVVDTELIPALGRFWTATQSEEGKKSLVDMKTLLHDAATVADKLAAAIAKVAHWAAVASDAMAKLKGGKDIAALDKVDRAAALPTGTTSSLASGIFSAFHALTQTGGIARAAGEGIEHLAAPLVPAARASFTGDINHERTVHVTVKGGNSPHETGAAVAGGVNGALDDELATAFRSLVGGGH
jgi:minor tail protein